MVFDIWPKFSKRGLFRLNINLFLQNALQKVLHLLHMETGSIVVDKDFLVPTTKELIKPS